MSDLNLRARVAPADPVKLVPDPTTGTLTGSNGRYEKRLTDLEGLYRDEAAFFASLKDDDGAPVYWVESSEVEPGPGGLITGISVLEPGRVGAEYYMTRGHLHAEADRSEVYTCVHGHGVMLLETLDGRSEAVELRVGETVYVPGHWIHRSVNVGQERFATVFVYAADAGQDYEVIREAGGMRSLVVADGQGWTTVPNPDHVGYRG